MKSISQLNKQIEEISIDLKTISNELAEIDKISKQVSYDINLEKVSSSAKAVLFDTHPLKYYDVEIKKYHLLLLFSMTFYYSHNRFDEFVYLYRIAFSSDYAGDLKELHASSLKMTEAQLDAAVSALRKAENDNGRLCEFTAVELLIIARMYSDNKEQAFRYLSRLFALFGFDDAKLSFVMSLADVILTQRVSEFKTPYEYLPNQFYCYINCCEKVMKHILDSRSVVYLRQPYRKGYFTRSLIFDFFSYDIINNMGYVSFIGTIQKNDSYGVFLITKQIGLDDSSKAFESVPANGLQGQTDKIGYYHSKLDFKFLSIPWYKDQPNLDPEINYDYSIENRGKKDKWAKEFYYNELRGNSIGILRLGPVLDDIITVAQHEHDALLARIRNKE